MGDMSKDFDRAEFACPCCGADDIDPTVVKYCQLIRDRIGKPVCVSSGVRCRSHNQAVGGVTHSSHLKGLAADIYVDGMSNSELGKVIQELYREGKMSSLYYCYLIKGKTSTGVHFDVDASKYRTKVFEF